MISPKKWAYSAAESFLKECTAADCSIRPTDNRFFLPDAIDQVHQLAIGSTLPKALQSKRLEILLALAAI